MLKNYYHHSWVRKTRSIFRKLGLISIIKSFLVKRKKNYEEAFHAALKAAIIPGDIVWDVGAHVGLYTNYFLDWVGEAGEVVAFEPLPSSFLALTVAVDARLTNNKNAVLKPIALSDFSGEALFTDDKSDDKMNTRAAHLIETPENGKGIKVRVETADDAVIKEHLSIPNVIKIDVEGFEESVLLGGEKTFSNLACRHMLIEIHFQIMDDRKLGDSAGRIVKLLKKWGYKVRWIDSAHLHASR